MLTTTNGIRLAGFCPTCGRPLESQPSPPPSVQPAPSTLPPVRDGEVLKPAEVGRLFRISVRTLYRLAEEGKIGHIKISAHGLRFYRHHVETYLKENTFESPKEGA